MTDAGENAPHRPALSAWLLALALLLGVLPFLTVGIAPLCDLPNHLGRVHVLAHFDEDPLYAEFYVREPAVLPNLALDLIAVPLAQVCSTECASVLFTLLLALVWVGGAAATARALGHSAGFAAALAATTLHSLALEYGFVNYVFGLGLAALAFAAWVATRTRPVLRLLLVVPLAVAVFFCHLMPLVFLGVLVGCYEFATWLGSRPRSAASLGRSIAQVAAVFVVPAVLYLGFSPTRAELTGSWTMPELSKKLSQLATPFSIGGGVADFWFTGALAVALLLLATVGRARLRPFAILVVVVMFGLFLITPQKTATADNISLRLPPAIAFLLVCLLRVDAHTLSNRRLRICAAAVATLLLARTAQITIKWRAEAHTYTAISEAFAKAPRGASVYTLRDVPNRRQIRETWHPPLAHAAGLALLEQPVWIPQLFANDGQQPLVVRDPELLATRFVRGDPMPTYRDATDFATWLDALQSSLPDSPAVVLHLHSGNSPELTAAAIAKGATELGRGDRWAVWNLPSR